MRSRFSVQRCQHSSDEPSVDRTKDRMVDGGLTERAVFRHDPQLSTGVFAAGREAMRSKSFCHHSDGGLEGTLSFARGHCRR
jgi:hypothetical protein